MTSPMKLPGSIVSYGFDLPIRPVTIVCKGPLHRPRGVARRLFCRFADWLRPCASRSDMDWEVLQATATCTDCGEDYEDFHVPHAVWARVVRPDGWAGGGTLCWECFMRRYLALIHP